MRLVLFYDAGQVPEDGKRYAWQDFMTSTGAEIRFFMPVLNVPFRLIFAHNPQREGVYDNNLQPANKYVFKFAVGSTFYRRGSPGPGRACIRLEGALARARVHEKD